MIFRQLVEPLSNTYTYLLGCEDTAQAVLIDPVVNSIDRDLRRAAVAGADAGLHARHAHPCRPHHRRARTCKEKVGSKIAAPAIDRLAVRRPRHRRRHAAARSGSVEIEPLHTPGHTDGHFAYRCGDRLFSGDALLIEGCGRTDFQNGDATDAVRERDREAVHSARRHAGLSGPRLQGSPRLDDRRRRSCATRGSATVEDLDEFEAIMAALDLPYPKFIDYAVPGNRACGVCPHDLPDTLRDYCEQMTDSPQG